MNVKYIVIHCADTPSTMDIGAKEIDQWHRQNGWEGIGYHFVVRRNGLVEPGRPLDTSMLPGWQVKQGAHVAGHNAESIGVCLVGGRDKGSTVANFTNAQWNSLDIVVSFLSLCFPGAQILGHRDLDTGKECPCFDVKHWITTGERVPKDKNGVLR